ncbi:hypothetical protein PGTUg99_009597 [Puccinia graminis f. sp. tritici]|uniref:Retrotransposon Copia-like N-terminal domain-containing protein n=1 Tax=Puccinia graminis f. sp. tritici TaxID=56615 RepID=A0A5B0NX41_PUCGR|nr:hypothetical protein PGTUg99_009597 [Puccinia graminis f. sp. tritici]
MGNFGSLLANLTSTSKTTDLKTPTSPPMEKLNAMILKTAIEAIPLLTQDNFSMWNNRVVNFLELQKVKDQVITGKGALTAEEELQVRTILMSKLDPSVHSNVINHENATDVVVKNVKMQKITPYGSRTGLYG